MIPGPDGREVPVHTLPRPIQKELPVWVTTAGSTETWQRAGSIGANVLAALVGYSPEDLRDQIAGYRRARAEAGHDPARGRVSLVAHTYVGTDEAAVKNAVREPFRRYLESSADLWQVGDARLKDLSPRKKSDMLEFAFERYYQQTALMGSLESCAKMVRAVAEIGVNEIASLIDFGLPFQTIMDGMTHLDALRRWPERITR